MNTAEKLRSLIPVVRRNRRFNTMDRNHDIIAIGLRVNEDGTVSRKPTDISDDTRLQIFAEKYGITVDEAFDIAVGFLGYEEIIKDDFSTKQAADLLERLAQKYE